jgi:hypothetical protein
MKQRAQFKLTGIAGIAGKRYEAEKNRRQLLRGMGVKLAVTPTPEQRSNKLGGFDFAALEKRVFAGFQNLPKLEIGRSFKLFANELRIDGARVGRVDNLRMDLERPAKVDPAAEYDSYRAQWRLHNPSGVPLMVWDRYGCEMYPHACHIWESQPWVSEWKPSCRAARGLHYNRLAGDARVHRNAIARSRAVRVGEGFARVIQQFGYARAELYNAHQDHKEIFGKSDVDDRLFETWRCTTSSRGTDPMFLTAEDAYDKELAAHPYYLGHAFTEATGWYLLGAGAYSYAFANDNYPGIVVKLGKSRTDACFKYLAWSQRNQHLHGVPSVYFLSDYQMDYTGSGFYVAVLDALTENTGKARRLDLPQRSRPREWEQSIPDDATAEMKALYETLELVWQSTDGHPDLHAGNILFTKEGFPVIADPCC